MGALDPTPGERVWDLFAGAGLFSVPAAAAVGTTGRVVAVESHPAACTQARANLADAPHADVVHARVDRWLRTTTVPPNLVILDPPRKGATASVVDPLARLRPRAIAYVACDPAGLARDVALFARAGYRLEQLRAFDLFPMTHHVECVATLVPGPASDAL
jgi:tRNA/tmRNA/rRNA uracil-C5-methylase (TrmA/RlmC/RlmD family)